MRVPMTPLARLRRPLAGLLVLLAAGCALPTESAATAVEARGTEAGIVATNHTTVAIRYVVIDPRTLAFTLYLDCRSPDAPCPTIPAGETVLIPWSGVDVGGTAGRQYYFGWVAPPPLDRSGSIEIVRP